MSEDDYAHGFNAGWDSGFSVGWDDGYDGGWVDAFCEGYRDGREAETGAIADDRGAWWPCKWCGDRADCYRVRDELWRTYGPPTQGWLCAGCFEDRLGRKLVREDMLDCCDTADNLWATIVAAREAA
ncbi:hypothetical protein [Mycobacterium avium]|uniref:hypothetical protein n=1 Tax=Mycobacterium avium TaxID=1764 RepID=UPI0003D21F42|nr:hypothetical protein [Mycobacterium avium]ETB29465.1 hypothetical protein O971_12375 [Mycobacterium avium subsp. hominissuis 10-4249]KDO96333.1 hypothetical protein MAVA5_11550 [Mycobacterium avium subsp. hominissuis A5]